MNKIRSLSIASQIGLTSLILVTLASLVTSSILIYLGFQAQIATLSTTQDERSRAVAGEINAYVDDLQRKLAYLARVQGFSTLDATIQDSLLEGLLRHNKAYENLTILDNQGQVVAILPDTIENLDRNQSESLPFLYAFNSQEEFVSSVEFDATQQFPFVTMAVPIRNNTNEVDGVLLAKVNLRFLWSVLSRTAIGQTGYSYIIDRSHFLIAQQGDTLENFALRDISSLPYLDALLYGQLDSHSRYQGLRGTEVLGKSAFIPSADWHVIIEMPIAEIYAPVYTHLSVLGIALALSMGAAIGVSYWLSKQITAPLQELSRVTRQISADKFDIRINIDSTNELGVLAQSFNSMSEHLRETLEALHKSEAHYRALLNAVPDLIFLNQADGTFIDYHSQNQGDLMTHPDEIIGRKSGDLLPPELASRHLHHIEQALQTGKEQVYTYTALARDHQLKDFEARIVVSGENEVLTIVRDITLWKQMEAEHLNFLLEKERTQILGKFITQASHEFKTPLSIMGSSAYLLKKISEPSQQARHIEKIEHQIRQIVLLVDSLTFMAQLDSGMHAQAKESINLNQLLTSLLATKKESLEEKKLSFCLQCPENPLLFSGDFDFVKRALEALVDNAIAYNKIGGTLTIVAQAQETHALIAISDTGIGMSPEHLPHIFDRFYRIDQSGTTRGFGLGLPIAKAIIDYYEGSLEVASQLGSGSTFRVLLPLSNAV